MGVVRGTRDWFLSRQVISFFPGCAGKILNTPGMSRIKLVSGVFGDYKVFKLSDYKVFRLLQGVAIHAMECM